MKAQPGHLATGPLNLKQSEQSRKRISSRQQYNEAEKRAKPVELGWKVKTKGE